MTIAYWCVLIAGLMAPCTVAIAKWGRRDFDNSEPRAWLDKQSGLRRRADFAHRNHFEAFPFFAAGVIIAHQVHAAQTTLNTLALVFIAARLIYTACYLTDKSSLRSLAWVIGFAAVIALFVLSAMAPVGH
ncbi:MAPEG family protein [Glaciimonas sp. PAMC28666]|uniref:MAPEG family protein n=1 Tax=Glaciimonas sp. PAMC28666 TaxID=2807626 RepID=UPI00196602A9|nr:MAPEG family protein [Glaciimonas sp. PAMC28666]QRX81243.1 MAPEG family protein [Glaciimonas sp. PAMC28666]